MPRKNNNPDGLMSQARERYKAFHGSDPRLVEEVEVDSRDMPTILIEIGRATAVEYDVDGSSNRRGQRYRHEFGDTGGKKKARSNVSFAVSPDGTRFFLVPRNGPGKKPKFTERGVVG